MILCIDCGNTRLKWGLYDGDGRRWLEQGALALAGIERLPGLLACLPPPARVIACNVASDEAGAAVEAAITAMAGIAPGLSLVWAKSRQEQCGVKNTYDDPAQLGPDRWAALIGARHMHAGPCLVVNAGTATTVDVLDAAGVFRGGLILPGVSLMQTALASDTARLPLATGRFSPLPRNTADAIASGALQATVGAISRMFAPVAASPAALCLLSGGAADPLEALLEEVTPLKRVDNLVLAGLAQMIQAGD
ncbi:MAG: type III pantothenate kinase [Betaproteobacteria bacterium]|nr:type III pantothenate kinase [Betaproteobacteria bacterium]